MCEKAKRLKEKKNGHVFFEGKRVIKTGQTTSLIHTDVVEKEFIRKDFVSKQIAKIKHLLDDLQEKLKK